MLGGSYGVGQDSPSIVRGHMATWPPACGAMSAPRTRQRAAAPGARSGPSATRHRDASGMAPFCFGRPIRHESTARSANSPAVRRRPGTGPQRGSTSRSPRRTAVGSRAAECWASGAGSCEQARRAGPGRRVGRPVSTGRSRCGRATGRLVRARPGPGPARDRAGAGGLEHALLLEQSGCRRTALAGRPGRQCSLRLRLAPARRDPAEAAGSRRAARRRDHPGTALPAPDPWGSRRASRRSARS